MDLTLLWQNGLVSFKYPSFVFDICKKHPSSPHHMVFGPKGTTDFSRCLLSFWGNNQLAPKILRRNFEIGDIFLHRISLSLANGRNGQKGSREQKVMYLLPGYFKNVCRLILFNQMSISHDIFEILCDFFVLVSFIQIIPFIFPFKSCAGNFVVVSYLLQIGMCPNCQHLGDESCYLRRCIIRIKQIRLNTPDPAPFVALETGAHWVLTDLLSSLIAQLDVFTGHWLSSRIRG